MLRRNESKQSDEFVWIKENKMDTNLIKILFGFFVVVNILGISLEWIRIRTDIIKLSDKTMNLIYVIISLCGGFVGVLLGAEMMGLKQENKVLKKLIPILVFVEICVIVWIFYLNR